MLRRMSITDLMAAIQEQIREGTGLPCYDSVPANAESPFCYMSYAGSQPADTKTMFVDRHTVDIHVIADVSPSSVPVFRYIQALEQAMTEDVTIPKEYKLVRQSSGGVRTIQDDESGEKHAVMSFTFLISYGYKTKI